MVNFKSDFSKNVPIRIHYTQVHTDCSFFPLMRRDSIRENGTSSHVVCSLFLNIAYLFDSYVADFTLAERLYTPTCMRTSPFVACPRAIQFVTNLYFSYEPTYKRVRSKYGKRTRRDSAFLLLCALEFERNVVWVDNDFGLVTMFTYIRNEIKFRLIEWKI